MDFSYAAVPFFAWLVAGSIKFSVNSVKGGRLEFSQIGYGGFPSNHITIVSSVAALVALREGIGHPAFGVAVALVFIVMLDAGSLRRQLGKQAEAINRLNSGVDNEPLRERMGHTPFEMLAGVVLGVLVAWTVTLTISA